MLKRAFFVVAIACTAVLPALDFPESSSRSAGRVIGDFLIIAKARDDSVILGNNKAYKPTHHHYAKLSKLWRKGNRVRLIKADDHEYVLINLSRAQTIKTKRLKLEN